MHKKCISYLIFCLVGCHPAPSSSATNMKSPPLQDQVCFSLPHPEFKPPLLFLTTPFLSSSIFHAPLDCPTTTSSFSLTLESWSGTPSFLPPQHSFSTNHSDCILGNASPISFLLVGLLWSSHVERARFRIRGT